MIAPTTHCRICGNHNLITVVDLGEQSLTGVFPRTRDEKVTSGPLRLVKCHNDNSDACCGLVQLSHSYDLNELYGQNYGYRSGLNKSMVDHLQGKIKKIRSIAKIEKGDLIIDIGSNDSTSLQAYPANEFRLLGIDPTGAKFSSYYPKHVDLTADFFSKDVVRDKFGNQKAKVITSFSMFYDLERPMDFMREVHEVLEDEGIWVFEQSYLPTMLETNSFDTICQEHLEYYALSQIKWMTDRVGFRIIDLELNDINGGSFSVTVAKKNSSFKQTPEVESWLSREDKLRISRLDIYHKFYTRIEKIRKDLRHFLKETKRNKKTVYGLGASTKGNVILQYCGITTEDLPCIGEVNSDKLGCYTPGTQIPIVSEDELMSINPDYLLVLPWHFRKFFENSAKFKGCSLVFPLPELQIVSTCGIK